MAEMSQMKPIPDDAIENKTCNCVGRESAPFPWGKLKISAEELGSMPYGNIRVTVHPHMDNWRKNCDLQKRFYYHPTARLANKSAVGCYNSITHQSEIQFRIEMWNIEMELRMAKFVSVLTNSQVYAEQIQVVPFEKVMLVNTTPNSKYKLPNIWKPYRMNKSIWFSMTTLNIANESTELVKAMHDKPHLFNGEFQLLFGIEHETCPLHGEYESYFELPLDISD